MSDFASYKPEPVRNDSQILARVVNAQGTAAVVREYLEREDDFGPAARAFLAGMLRRAEAELETVVAWDKERFAAFLAGGRS